MDSSTAYSTSCSTTGSSITSGAGSGVLITTSGAAGVGSTGAGAGSTLATGLGAASYFALPGGNQQELSDGAGASDSAGLEQLREPAGGLHSRVAVALSVPRVPEQRAALRSREDSTEPMAALFRSSHRGRWVGCNGCCSHCRNRYRKNLFRFWQPLLLGDCVARVRGRIQVEISSFFQPRTSYTP